jgi:hypothetical protein
MFKIMILTFFWIPSLSLSLSHDGGVVGGGGGACGLFGFFFLKHFMKMLCTYINIKNIYVVRQEEHKTVLSFCWYNTGML